jgi:hypothetical protein
VRPEFQLLLCCARVQLTPGYAARIKALIGEGLDWSYLKEEAARHGMLPLLYWHLREVNATGIPQDFLVNLQEHFQNNTKHNLFLISELIKLLRLFDEHRVSSVAFKGPLQADVLYHNIALREFLDLDILVRPDDVPKVASLLADHSYKPLPPLPPVQEAFYLRTQCERTFARADGKCYIDLHWAITSDLFPFPVSTDHLLQRLEPAMLSGFAVKTLDTTDLLLVLCVHAAKDRFCRLESLCAVGEMLRAGGVDWPRVLRLAKDLYCERLLLSSLELAHDLLDVALPPEILKKVQSDAEVKHTVGQARARLFHGGRSGRGMLGKNYWRFRVMDRRRDALRATLKAAMVPNLPDWKLLSLPAPLFFLYYLVRPIRLALKHGLSLFKR